MNTSSKLISFQIMSTAIIGALVANGAEFRSGDKVVVVHDADLRVKDKVVGYASPGNVLTVTAVSGQHLWVDFDSPGWLNDSAVVPLDRSAIDALTALIERKPGDAYLHSGRAQVWHKLGENDIAIADFNEAIRLSPESSLYAGRAVIWQAKEDYARALEDCSESLRLNPNNAYAYSCRGSLRIRQRKWDKAIADFDMSLRLKPELNGDYLNRGYAHHSTGREYGKAVFDYEKSIETNPKHVIAYVNLAFLYATARNEEFRDARKSLKLAEQALQIAPEYGYALAAKACALALQGDFDSAIGWQNKALKDSEYASYKGIDGGVHASDRIALWTAKKLWFDNLVSDNEEP